MSQRTSEWLSTLRVDSVQVANGWRMLAEGDEQQKWQKLKSEEAEATTVDQNQAPDMPDAPYSIHGALSTRYNFRKIREALTELDNPMILR